jgi:hypothetical protein
MLSWPASQWGQQQRDMQPHLCFQMVFLHLLHLLLLLLWLFLGVLRRSLSQVQ